MNKYAAFYEKQQIEIESTSSYAAQKRFQKMFPRKKVKPYDIAVALLEKEGEPVVHAPMM